MHVNDNEDRTDSECEEIPITREPIETFDLSAEVDVKSASECPLSTPCAFTIFLLQHATSKHRKHINSEFIEPEPTIKLQPAITPEPKTIKLQPVITPKPEPMIKLQHVIIPDPEAKTLDYDAIGAMIAECAVDMGPQPQDYRSLASKAAPPKSKKAKPKAKPKATPNLKAAPPKPTVATPKSKPKAKAKPKSATKPSSIEAVDDPVMKYMDVDVSDAIEVQKVKKRLHSCVYHNEVKRRLKNDVPRDQAKLHGQTAAAQVVGRWNVILNLAEAEDVD